MMRTGSVVSGVLAVALGATLIAPRRSWSATRSMASATPTARTTASKCAGAAAHRAAQQAAAERAANPLVRLFGSPTHSNATEAQARAQQVLAQPSQAIDLTSSVRSSRAAHSAESQVVPRAASGTGRSAPDAFEPNASAPS